MAIWSALAFDRGRGGRAGEAQAAASRAMEELARVDRAQLAETDVPAYQEAALLAGASRPAADVARAAASRLSLQLSPREAGETCLSVVEVAEARKGKAAAAARTLIERCTYGQVWPASIRISPKDNAVAVAVQPLASWRELWVFREREGEWSVEPVVPGSEAGLGYVEWAGWTPDGRRMLAARETRSGGRFSRSFELLRLDGESVAVERRAERPQDLTPFYRWQAPDWKEQTLALR